MHWYKGQLLQENFYTSTKMALYKNELIEKGDGVKQEQRFVLSPLNSTTLLI